MKRLTIGVLVLMISHWCQAADWLAAGPRFVDSENGDFRLKPDSPALKLGFVPIDQSKISLVP